jgi:o-succinylbenzoate synthase
VRLEVKRRTLRLRQPLLTSYGEISERRLLAVTLTDKDGVQGHGEAAPLEPYDGVSIERAETALRRFEPALAEADGLDDAKLVDRCRRADALPAALAAIDLALWDRAGRISGKPIASMLSDDPAPAAPVNATLWALDPTGAFEQAAAAAAGGYRCVKVKVGVGDDAARVAAVRAAVGPMVALRLDANGAWDVEQAVRAIDMLAPAGLELVEEPVHGLRGVREVRERVAVRISIDETAAEQGALGARVADAVCLKISRCGGIGGLIAAATLVRASGAEAYLASSFDGPLGIAAGIHSAAALASRGQPMPHCGLATLDLFAGFDNPLPARHGQIAVPGGPGLGVEPL